MRVPRQVGSTSIKKVSFLLRLLCSSSADLVDSIGVGSKDEGKVSWLQFMARWVSGWVGGREERGERNMIPRLSIISTIKRLFAVKTSVWRLESAIFFTGKQNRHHQD